MAEILKFREIRKIRRIREIREIWKIREIREIIIRMHDSLKIHSTKPLVDTNQCYRFAESKEKKKKEN